MGSRSCFALCISRSVKILIILLSLCFVFLEVVLTFAEERSKLMSDLLIALKTSESPVDSIELCDKALASGLLSRYETGMVHSMIGASYFEMVVILFQEVGSKPQKFLQNEMAFKSYLKKCIQHYNIAILINPSYWHNYWNRGTSYELFGRYSEALNDFNKVIQLKPDFARAYFYRARSLKATGRFDLALADLKKALYLEPENQQIIDEINSLHEYLKSNN